MSSADNSGTTKPRFSLRRETILSLHVKSALKSGGCQTQGCTVSLAHGASGGGGGGPHVVPSILQ